MDRIPRPLPGVCTNVGGLEDLDGSSETSLEDPGLLTGPTSHQGAPEVLGNYRGDLLSSVRCQGALRNVLLWNSIDQLSLSGTLTFASSTQVPPNIWTWGPHLKPLPYTSDTMYIGGKWRVVSLPSGHDRPTTQQVDGQGVTTVGVRQLCELERREVRSRREPLPSRSPS